MFIEEARRYATLGASVIAVPRATSGTSDKLWKQVLSTMALLSGCFVLSSNRVTSPEHRNNDTQSFNGEGWAINPLGEIIAETSSESPFVTVALDLNMVQKARQEYP